MYYFFYLPIGTELSVSRPPRTVISLVTLNIVWFLLFHLQHGAEGPMAALAFDGSHPNLVSALTACFLHADLFHLLGNLVFLFALGPALEDRIGSRRFLLLYLACGLIGMAAQAEAWRLGVLGATHPVIVGASGAISGILGVFVVRCGFARIQVVHATAALVQGQVKMGRDGVNATVAIVTWLVLQWVYGLVAQAAGGSPTAFASHLAGGIAGILLALALGLSWDGTTERLWLQAKRQARQGNPHAALGELTSYLRRVPTDAYAWLETGRMQRVLRMPREARRSWNRGIFLLWLERRRDRAVEAARELRRHYPNARLKASLLYRLGLYLERQGDLGWASHTFEDYAHHYPTHERAARALLKAARIEARRRDDFKRAGLLYTRIVEGYGGREEARTAAVELGQLEAIAANRGRVA